MGKIMKLGCVLLTGLLVTLGGAERAKAFTVLQLADILPGAVGSDPQHFTVFGGELIFSAFGGIAGGGVELWRYDGTNVTRVADINPGTGNSSPEGFTVFGSELIFSADDGTDGVELWSYDGTSVTQLFDINPGSGGSFPEGFTVLGSELIFSADNGTDGDELWRYNGTSVTQVRDINSGGGSSSPAHFEVFGSEVIFRADDGTMGTEPWSYDGTNVTQLRDINPGTGGSLPGHFTVFGSEVIFRADDGATGEELWSYDGTNVTQVADIWQFFSSSSPTGFTVFGSELIFRADDGTHGDELWSYDGTNVTQVDDINPGPGHSTPTFLPLDLRVFGSELIFSADDGTKGAEPWRYDGTSVTQLRDINLGAGNSFPGGFTVFGSELIFAADDGATGSELWRYDGTNVTQVADINPGAVGSIGRPWDLTVFGSELIFNADDGTADPELWVLKDSVFVSGTTIDHNWTSVSLLPAFLDPVVIAGPPTYHGSDPGVVRLRNVSGTGFEARFQEWAYLNVAHVQETLPYLVAEHGRHVMADGSIWEAGSFFLGGTGAWQSKVFTQPFAGRPALFLTVQTFSGSQPVTVRARNVTANDFEAALFEEEALMASSHVSEEVGYLAIYSSAGSGSIGMAGPATPYLLQSPLVDQRFAPVLSSALKVEEEQSNDAELGHINETLSMLALGRQIFAQDVSSTGSDSAALRRLAPEYGAPMEWGTVDGVTQAWTRVPLAKSFTNPVVVVKPVSARGADPGVIGVRNVTSSSFGSLPTFDLRYQEWLYLNGVHIPERVFYLVAEAGQFTVAGLDVEAGTLNSSLLLGGGFNTVTFSTGFFATPAVFTGVMTANGVDPVITRVDGVTVADFYLTMDEEEARRAGGHITETLGWIAVEPGSGTTTDNRAVAVGQTTADHQPGTSTQLGFTAARQFPVMVADVVSIFGEDPVSLRYRNLTAKSAELYLQEEQSLDAETAHVFEDVSIFAAE